MLKTSSLGKRGGGGIEVINREPKQVSKLIWLWGLGRLFLEKCIITFNKSVANFIIFWRLYFLGFYLETVTVN